MIAWAVAYDRAEFRRVTPLSSSKSKTDRSEEEMSSGNVAATIVFNAVCSSTHSLNEFSGVAGLTYNFKNTDTNYQNGMDLHFDWGASHFFAKQIELGIVGYYFQQVTDDFGAPAALGGVRSRIVGVRPQIGYIFPMGDKL
jgi:hypothetical protein